MVIYGVDGYRLHPWSHKRLKTAGPDLQCLNKDENNYHYRVTVNFIFDAGPPELLKKPSYITLISPHIHCSDVLCSNPVSTEISMLKHKAKNSIWMTNSAFMTLTSAETVL